MTCELSLLIFGPVIKTGFEIDGLGFEYHELFELLQLPLESISSPGDEEEAALT